MGDFVRYVLSSILEEKIFILQVIPYFSLLESFFVLLCVLFSSFFSCVSPFCNQGLQHSDFCDALRDLVPFVKFKKHKKYSWRSVSVKLQASGKSF